MKRKTGRHPKMERNARLHAFYLAHPTWSLRSIAGQFRITAGRVLQIVQAEEIRQKGNGLREVKA